MSDFYTNVFFNKMADFYLDEMKQKVVSDRRQFNAMVKDGATEAIANHFHLTYQEAEDALVTIHSKHAKKINLKFPITTAGLRKLAYYRTGVLDCLGENIVQCIDVPDYFVDWVFQKMTIGTPFVEFGKMTNNMKWKRCESTGLWFYDKKPPLRCDIELCLACQGYFPVYDTIRDIKLKFFYWDSAVKSFDNYMTFYEKFHEIGKKNEIVLDFKSKEVKYMYAMRIFRLMATKRFATGDLYFRYGLSESYVKDYLDVHHKMLDQLADLPINQATQIVNTCLNDTIVMATEEEVARWIKDYLNNHCYLQDLEGSLELASELSEDSLPIRVQLTKNCDSFSAPFILRNHVQVHDNDPNSVRFCSVVTVHRDIPIGCRVSRIRLLEHFKDVEVRNMKSLEEHGNRFLYVYTKADWYLPIPPFVRIDNPKAQLAEVWEDGEEEDGCYIKLLHSLSKKNLCTGEVVDHKEGEEIYVQLEQLDNIDDYPWEIFNSDREMDVYCFRVKVSELIRVARNETIEQIPEDMIRVEIWKEFGSWHGQNMSKTIAKEIFETPWENLVHTSPSDYQWK
jgi:hypothetical protein